MLNLILFGPPGSGKGTQSDLLIKKFDLLHLSTGDLLRDEMNRETSMGLEAKKFINEGQLVPDEVVIGMIESAITNHPHSKGFIFDGFPRTIPQAEALDDLLAKNNKQIALLIRLVVPEDELIERLLKRGKNSGRKDDNKTVISQRIIEYKDKTKAVADFYEQQDKLEIIEGVGSIEAISKKINQIVSPYLKQ